MRSSWLLLSQLLSSLVATVASANAKRAAWGEELRAKKTFSDPQRSTSELFGVIRPTPR